MYIDEFIIPSELLVHFFKILNWLIDELKYNDTKFQFFCSCYVSRESSPLCQGILRFIWKMLNVYICDVCLA